MALASTSNSWGEAKSSPHSYALRSSTEERSSVKGVVRGANPLGEPVSYKKRRLKKSKLNQLKYKLGLVKIALLKFIQKVVRKEGKMRLPQTRAIMQWLRERSRIIRPNNLRINEWVDDYIDRCVKNGEPITILTQLCISKDLEVRYKKQGDVFIPTKQERLLFEKEIPQIAEAFEKNGLRFNWWITFNRSYLDSGRLSEGIEAQYKRMLIQIVEPLLRQGWLMITDWEDEILGKRPKPNPEVLKGIEKLINPSALEVEIQRHSSWAREEAGLNQTDAELRQDVYFQIACEAEEGGLLSGGSSLFGDFILLPLEAPERYVFFSVLAPDFQKRIVAVLKPYPWRLG